MEHPAPSENTAMDAAETLQNSPVWQTARDGFFANGDAAAVLAALTASTEGIVRQAFAASVDEDGPATLLAVGALARGLTFPYSGADLLLLCADEAEIEALKPRLVIFTQHLWDRGLQLNCASTTLGEVLDGRTRTLEVMLSLFDRRRLGGDPARLTRLEKDLPAALDRQGGRLRQELVQATRARHALFQNTPHHLVPDVKKGPGGLLDLRLIRLLNQLGPEREPDARLDEAADFFAQVRCYLHFQAGRNLNLVDAEARQALSRPPFSDGGDPLAWMRGYHRHARAVLSVARPALDAAERVSGSLLSAYHDYRAHLSNSEFSVVKDQLLLRHPSQLASDPDRFLRMMAFVARHGVDLAPDTAWRLNSAREGLAGYLTRPERRWPALETVLALPHADRALRALEPAGLLPLLLPGWEDIEGLPLDGPEHRFTADEHTLRCFEALAGLRGPITAESDPLRHRFAVLLNDCDHPEELGLALALHTMSSAGATAALDRLQPPEDVRARVEYLLQHHGELAAAATARDLGDPDAARSLAELAGTVEQLKQLVLVSFAQLAATSVESLASWRLEQLWQAYNVGRAALNRGLESDRIREVPATLPGRAEFIQGFPTRYLRAHTRAELQLHAELEVASRASGVAVRLDPTLAGYRIVVIAPDRPGLFASFAGALASFGMNILKAEAFANSSGVILDTFLFADSNRMLQLNPSESERLTDLFRRVAQGRTDARRLMRSTPTAPSSVRRAHADVRFEDDANSPATLVEVHADDRPGLLYSLASTFAEAGCDIHVVLIDTKGHRAQDVFYVAHGGAPLSLELRAELAEKLRNAC